MTIALPFTSILYASTLAYLRMPSQRSAVLIGNELRGSCVGTPVHWDFHNLELSGMESAKCLPASRKVVGGLLGLGTPLMQKIGLLFGIGVGNGHTRALVSRLTGRPA
jgi:hypothetical protein